MGLDAEMLRIDASEIVKKWLQKRLAGVGVFSVVPIEKTRR